MTREIEPTLKSAGFSVVRFTDGSILGGVIAEYKIQ
jgi:hypothetical protein